MFPLPGIDQRRRVPTRAIRALAKIIAEKFDPEKIVLFGSHAYGHPQPWSDVDLLVVMDTPNSDFNPQGADCPYRKLKAACLM